MIRHLIQFCRRSIRNKLMVALSLATAIFLLFPSALSIFALRKQLIDHLGLTAEKVPVIQHLLLTQTITLVLISLLTIVALAILVGLIAYGIAHPITELADETEKMAVGTRDLKPLPFEQEDEVGILTKSINHFIGTIDNMEKEKSRDAALTAIGRVSAELAHEIRNPLGSIDLFCQLFEEQWSEKEYQASFLRNVPVELERIKNLVNGLLEVARPIQLDFKKIDAKKVLMLALEEYKNGNYPQLTLHLEISEGPWEVEADEFALLRVFKNLIQNAVQAMEEQGELIVSLKKVDDKIALHIKDSGPGMDEETLNKIFEPFFSKKRGGTGLGLAICRKIVNGHGGQIFAQSQPGVGTTFSVQFPKKAPLLEASVWGISQ